MGKKINIKFIKAYAQMETQCQEKFGITAGGVDEYISRLESARFAPNRDEVLGKLTAYEHIMHRFNNEPNAVKTVKEVTKADVSWVKKFTVATKKKKDSISRYLKSARKYARGRKIRRAFLFIFILALIAGAAVALWYFGLR